MSELFDVRDRNILITGASSGLGRHFAETLAARGARVALAARRLEKLNAVADAIRADGGTAVTVTMDVRDPQQAADAVDAAASGLGPLHALVNNSGVAITRPAMELEEADWMAMVDTNLNGAWRVAQATARHMKEHGEGGSIINIASILGRRVAAQIPAYAASKAGLIRLTEALALEWARHRIRVNAIAPGYIETDINRDFFQSETGQKLIKRVPQRRIGQTKDLDGALLLLASDASTFMTGSTITVDGGHMVSSL